MASLEQAATEVILVGDGWVEGVSSYQALCPAGGPASGHAYFTGFDFSSLPNNAVIDGVEFKFEGLAFVGINEVDVQMIDGGAPDGTNDAGAEWETASWKSFVHGGPTSLFGLSLTDDNFKTPTFGFALNLESAASSGPPSVALVRNPTVKVYYH